MKLIPLTQGLHAMVDDEDFERLSQFKWHAHKRHRSSVSYAERWGPRNHYVRRKIRMHHEVLGCSDMVDHIDGNGLNNQRKNLRRCTDAQNMMNRRKSRCQATSHFKGVCLSYVSRVAGPRWRAYIMIDKKQISLGSFATEIGAARAYDAAAIEHFGEFACLNFPPTPAAQLQAA